MSAIHDLIAQIGDPRLRERLAAECGSARHEQEPQLGIAVFRQNNLTKY